MTAPVDFKAIAASLPKRQRAAYRELASMASGWWIPSGNVSARTGDGNASARLRELEAKGLVESLPSSVREREWVWRVVREVKPQVVTGREHLLHLLRGLKAMVDNPPPVFALSEAQSKLLDEVNAVLSEGTKR